MSKVDTLRAAISYIHNLKDLIQVHTKDGGSSESGDEFLPSPSTSTSSSVPSSPLYSPQSPRYQPQTSDLPQLYSQFQQKSAFAPASRSLDVVTRSDAYQPQCTASDTYQQCPTTHFYDSYHNATTINNNNNNYNIDYTQPIHHECPSPTSSYTSILSEGPYHEMSPSSKPYHDRMSTEEAELLELASFLYQW